jgi:septum formation protein
LGLDETEPARSRGRDPVSTPLLILASASPRRAELLRQAGYVFSISPADVDEANLSCGLSPQETVRRLALAKAQVVAERFPDEVVLAADTIVALGEIILGKPADARDAREMLQLLSGTTQVVITGVAVQRRNEKLLREARVMSAVSMRMLTSADIDAYIATGNWKDKAGGYGIQDPDPFVIRQAGCTTNIVGLPMSTTRRLLAAAGIVPAGSAESPGDAT